MMTFLLVTSPFLQPFMICWNPNSVKTSISLLAKSNGGRTICFGSVVNFVLFKPIPARTYQISLFRNGTPIENILVKIPAHSSCSSQFRMKFGYFGLNDRSRWISAATFSLAFPSNTLQSNGFSTEMRG